MELKKKIKAYGNTNIIQLTKEEMEIGELETGNIVNVKIEKSDDKTKN